MTARPSLSLSGEKLTAVYQLKGSVEQARARAEDICVEQTVEFPVDLIERSDIRDQVIGKVVSVEANGPDRCLATVEFPVEAAGRELTQLLNVLFGNISLKPGIRLMSFSLPEVMLEQYRGPRFGIPGLRALIGVRSRPLICTAIKPMGLDAEALADIAYRFALGGVDLIKDDHGLADQSFAPFKERVTQVTDAVRKANRETRGNTRYAPNITAPADELMNRAEWAKTSRAGGLLIAPGIVGLDAMRRIADRDDIALPILSHPALQGSYCLDSESGISHGPLLGTLNRLAGADASIFPHFGGRFSFTPEACRELKQHAVEPQGNIKPIWPVPAGGMGVDRVKEMVDFYGKNIIVLIGGDLHRNGDDLAKSARELMARLPGWLET
jgi:ribulose-bisphosphate carboxylase large chain